MSSNNIIPFPTHNRVGERPVLPFPMLPQPATPAPQPKTFWHRLHKLWLELLGGE